MLAHLHSPDSSVGNAQAGGRYKTRILSRIHCTQIKGRVQLDTPRTPLERIVLPSSDWQAWFEWILFFETGSLLQQGFELL